MRAGPVADAAVDGREAGQNRVHGEFRLCEGARSVDERATLHRRRPGAGVSCIADTIDRLALPAAFRTDGPDRRAPGEQYVADPKAASCWNLPMLSDTDLERLTEADVGRRLSDLPGMTGLVRIEPRPVQRIVVDFAVRLDATDVQHDVRTGSWPDRTLADIRRNAEQIRRAGEAARLPVVAAPAAVTARALSQAPSASVAAVAIAPAVRSSFVESAPADSALPGAVLASVPAAGQSTFAEICEAWLTDALASRKDAGESVRRSMRKDVLPTLGGLPVRAVRRGQVVAVLERIVARGSVRQAGCVLADLRQMFRWAVQTGQTEADPTATLRKSEFGGAPEVRRRRLSDAELLELGTRMQAARLARHIRHAVWLMLATGARIGEVAQARWRDIDAGERLWTIPPEISHSGRAQTVPLSAFAMRHLFPQGEVRRSELWVFPGRVAAEALSPKALGKQIRDRQRGSHIRGRASGTTALLLPGGAWTPLDLRRTAAALMAELGVRSEVISACLDHAVRSETQRTYHRQPSMDERRTALDRLGQRLEAIERLDQDPKLRAA